MPKRKPKARKLVRGDQLLQHIPMLVVPPICVSTKIASTEYEGGETGGSYGDVLLRGYPVRMNDGGAMRASRFDLANKLREMAAHVASTHGDPIEDYSIFILMRRPRPKAS